MTKTIPATAIQIQEGLYLSYYSKTIGNKIHTFRHLHSKEGYCFYDKTQPIYNEEGAICDNPNLKQRHCITYASLGINKSLDDFVSVKIQDDSIIV